MSERMPALDPGAISRNFQRAAKRYDSAAVLAREVARRMDERLDYVKISPARILDLGCGTLADWPLLSQRYPDARYLGVDASLAMLGACPHTPRGWRRLLPGPRIERINACAKSLPFAASAFDLLWSNFMLHWLDDPLPAFGEMHRVLREDGLLMFSTLGPDTLRELRAASGGRSVHRFVDMHDLGDMLVAGGFADPVMDMETVTLTYAHVEALIADLRATGGCALAGRHKGLMGKNAASQLKRALEATRREGRLPATIELIYGHAWKPKPRAIADGRAIVHFAPRNKP